MRRPAPLPNRPEDRRGHERDDSAPGRGSVVLDPEDTGAPDSAAPSGPAPEEGAPISTSTRDVWRAARARRKALRAEIRRFTQRSRRRRIVGWSVAGALVLLVGGSVAAAYSPLFAVEKITIVGASSLDPAVLEAALADQIGTPLALVDSSEVKAALLAYPLIETYALEARPPHDLTVRIVERTPVGVIVSDAGYTLVDAAGVALSTTAERPAGQPELDITGGVGSRAFESAGLVIRSLPADVRSQLTAVRASTADDVTLTLESGLTVLWGSEEESVLKGIALAKALAANPGASSIDISSPDVAVVG
ncbi:FtsQ-type POTRA domain-containing protein [Microbacterium sp. 179-I 3D4 NHS]|uniref:FtsQ-type POTRA domain-containing protein n=1 Tax=Microbacterium sp. 179-I 3D4 NHS TaxID=3142381 RepID=UPI0039A390E6